MRKYLSIFNFQTVAVLTVSFISAYICVSNQFSMYVDYLILDFIIIFPLTFSLGMAFRRRERAIQYLSLFKASLQSVYYSFQISKLDNEKKNEFRSIAENLSASLLRYLTQRSKDSAPVQQASHSIFIFAQTNKEALKNTFAVKVFLFLFRMNESIEFLLATHRHRTPWGPRAIVLFAIYLFVLTYPATVLHDVPGAGFWYVALMTLSKGFILISFFNVQNLLENPFDESGADDVRLDDFGFLSGVTMIQESITVADITNEDPASEMIDEE